MSNIDCNACDSLRQTSPDFVLNGVTETVVASLKNNTGINPALTVLHDNCEDLNMLNDCLVGRMGDEVKAYDNCDWKEFMGKFIPNNYELLKAMIANECGIWSTMCASISSLFSLIGGTSAPYHFFTQTDTIRQKYTVTTEQWVDKHDYHIVLESEFRAGAGCGVGKSLFVWRLNGGYTESHWPYSPAVTVSGLQVGDVLGTIRKQDIIPNYATEAWWTSMARGYSSHHVGTIDQKTDIWIGLKAYIVIDGVEFNRDVLEEYGSDVMIAYVIALGADSLSSGGVWGQVDEMHAEIIG